MASGPRVLEVRNTFLNILDDVNTPDDDLRGFPVRRAASDPPVGGRARRGNHSGDEGLADRESRGSEELEGHGDGSGCGMATPDSSRELTPDSSREPTTRRAGLGGVRLSLHEALAPPASSALPAPSSVGGGQVVTPGSGVAVPGGPGNTSAALAGGAPAWAASVAPPATAAPGMGQRVGAAGLLHAAPAAAPDNICPPASVAEVGDGCQGAPGAMGDASAPPVSAAPPRTAAPPRRERRRHGGRIHRDRGRFYTAPSGALDAQQEQQQPRSWGWQNPGGPCSVPAPAPDQRAALLASEGAGGLLPRPGRGAELGAGVDYWAGAAEAPLAAMGQGVEAARAPQATLRAAPTAAWPAGQARPAHGKGAEPAERAGHAASPQQQLGSSSSSGEGGPALRGPWAWPSSSSSSSGEGAPGMVGCPWSDSDASSKAGVKTSPLSAGRAALAALRADCAPVQGVAQTAAKEARRTGPTAQELVDAVHAAAQAAGGGGRVALTEPREPRELLGALRREARTERLEAVESLKLLRALAKLGLRGQDVHWVVQHLETLVDPDPLCGWTSQDISLCLWSLAKMAPEGAPSSACVAASRRLAQKILARSASRVETFRPQCLAMSVHAVAKLRLGGSVVDVFVHQCVEECTSCRDLERFPPQSIANILWAATQLSHGDRSGTAWGLTDTQVWPLWRAVRHSAQPRLGDFPGQELSVVANCTSKLLQRATTGTSRLAPQGLSAMASAFLLEIAREAMCRVDQLSPQGVANIALSISTGARLADPRARDFLVAASTHSAHRIGEFEPQAISNFCCAIGRLCSEGRRGSCCATGGVCRCAEVISDFVDRAACETLRRVQRLGLAGEGCRKGPLQFGWVDLSGVLAALGNSRLRSGHILRLIVHVLEEATRWAEDLSLRVGLNVSLSAIRLGMAREHLEPLAAGMAERMELSGGQLTTQDKRQWEGVMRFTGRLATAGLAESPPPSQSRRGMPVR